MKRVIGWMALSIFAYPVHAQVLATCGESTGSSYFLKGGLIDDAGSGWVADGISNGGIILLQDVGGYDVVYTDIYGSKSAKADGARVIAVKHTDTAALVIVAYAEAIETYAFSFLNREVAWTQVKLAGLMDKAAVYVSKCK